MVAEESWFSPPWADDEDDAPKKASPVKLAGAGREPQIQVSTISKLIKAHTVLGRLDTIIAEAPPLVAKGALARIALSEASGFLAHHKARISARDLAMRSGGITGSYTVAQESGRLNHELIWTGGEMADDDLPDDWDVSAAIAFARHLKRVPAGRFPLTDIDHLSATLSELGVGVTDRDSLEDWIGALPSQYDRPGLLLPCWIAANGLPGRQREDKLDLGALFVAAAVTAQSDAFRHAPLMLWSAPTSWLDRLGFQGGDAFDHGFLDAITEAATAGLRETRHTIAVSEKIPALDERAGSNVIKAAWIAITEPVVTVGALATRLSLTTRATSSIINRLVESRFLTEITRRDSWRAYTIS